MYKPLKLKENIHYVGVNDRNTHLFENLWPLPQGVSYNSYVICDRKTVLIDTVDLAFSDLFFKNLNLTIGDKPIDYLIVNHMEPDHSGCIEILKSKYPDMQIVGNKRTADMLEGFYGITENVVVIEDRDELNIGEDTLEFHMAPMVHWPETMMAYLKGAKTLFSADAFGTFGTLDGGVMDSQLDPDKYWDEMVRYYSNIVGKFGSSVQTAMKKLSGLELQMICSTHGPVWTLPENIDKVLSLYDKLSKYEGDEGLVIAYGSLYGNTERVAEIIAAAAAENGIKNIVIHNTAKSSVSDILRDIFKYRGLIIGCATYNGKLYPPVESLLSAIENRGIKNRMFGYFSGHTWADGAKRELKAFAEKMKFEPMCDPVELKQSPSDAVIEKAYAMGTTMGKALKESRQLSGAEVTRE